MKILPLCREEETTCLPDDEVILWQAFTLSHSNKAVVL